MTARRFALGVVVVLTALLTQTVLLSRLPLPGAVPDLLLVVVVAFGLTEGSRSGAVTGMCAGLLADLGSDHELGRLALAYVLCGHLAGLVRPAPDRPAFLAPIVVALCAVLAVTVYAAEGVLLDDPRTTVAAYLRAIAATVTYCVALTPVVVPAVGLLVRRRDGDQPRRRPAGRRP